MKEDALSNKRLGFVGQQRSDEDSKKEVEDNIIIVKGREHTVHSLT